MRGAYGKYNVSFYYAGRLYMFFEVRLWLFKFAQYCSFQRLFGMTPQGGF